MSVKTALKAIRYSTPYVVGTISGFAVRSL